MTVSVIELSVYLNFDCSKKYHHRLNYFGRFLDLLQHARLLETSAPLPILDKMFNTRLISKGTRLPIQQDGRIDELQEWAEDTTVNPPPRFRRIRLSEDPVSSLAGQYGEEAGGLSRSSTLTNSELQVQQTRVIASI